jgi:hypothetical protein
MKGIIRLIQQLVYDEVKFSMSKMSIAVLMVSLMFLGALFFVIGYLSALTSISSTSPSQSSWQALSTHPGDAQHHPSQKQRHGLGGFFDRYAHSQVQQGLSDLKNKESSVALMVPKPLQPFARYGVGQANVQTRKLANQVNPFANRKNMGAPVVPQPYGPPPPQPYGPHGQMQQQPAPQYQQPPQYPYSQPGYPPPPQYQPPPPYTMQEYPQPRAQQPYAY